MDRTLDSEYGEKLRTIVSMTDSVCCSSDLLTRVCVWDLILEKRDEHGLVLGVRVRFAPAYHTHTYVNNSMPLHLWHKIHQFT